MRKFYVTAVSIIALAACSAPLDKSPAMEGVKFEKYALANGLDVILHVDRSDPVVAIDLTAHVGSARERPGRTGFAHLFEHLLFLDSENLGYGGLDEMNTRIGGEGTNGYTTNDVTKYFQAVPSDGLEKIIWAEADKLGYFIKTVSQEVIDNEKQVVKNEKRQRVDNQPFGHSWYVIGKALYPESHPYNWQVIGSLADLDAASLSDVQNFFADWYTPDNVTITLAGDFDPAQAKSLIEKYFGEIPAPDTETPDNIEIIAPMPVMLEASKSLMYVDSFATVPQLTYTWPTPPQYHADRYALDLLMSYLTDGKRAPLNQVLIDEQKLTSNVSTFNNTAELASEAYILVRANADQPLDTVKTAIDSGFARFEAQGISDMDLERLKAGQEVSFYQNIQSALGKAIALGEYNTFTGDPGFINTEIQLIRNVTPKDIMRVYTNYIKDKPSIELSVVPKGQEALAISGAILADIVEETVTQSVQSETKVDPQTQFDPAARVITDPTPSRFDRKTEPDFGDPVTLTAPQIWRGTLPNGMTVFGTSTAETPLVQFNIKIDAGDARASVDKPMVPTLTAMMLEKGTAQKTTAELENAIKTLGSSISISSGSRGIFVTGTTLARNFDDTVTLVTEMLTQPRWDPEEFDLLKRAVSTQIDQAQASPNAISSREFAAILYPADNIYSVSGYGEKSKLNAITLDDVKAFYAQNFTPIGGQIRVAGDVDFADVEHAMTDLSNIFKGEANPTLNISQASMPKNAKVYFYDVPGAKQSVLRFGYPSLAATHPDYFKVEAINYLLGETYTSQLNTELRVNRGYTYGIRSGFIGAQDRGTFTVRSSVRSNVTLESAQLIKSILESYGLNFTQEDLNTLKSALIKGQALKNETLSSKLSLIGDIADYGYSDDYRAQAIAQIEALTLTDVQELAKTYLRPNQMYYVVVGDAKTQADRITKLGFGTPIMLNK